MGRNGRIVASAIAALLAIGFGSPSTRAGEGGIAVQVGDAGQVEVRVRGEVCLTDFRVLMAGPGWKSSYSVAKCERKEALSPQGRKQVTVTGRIVRGAEEFGAVKAVVEWDERKADCNYELRIEKDADIEVIRLNGLLPVEASAGKAAWHIFSPAQMKTGLFPERLHDAPDFSGSGFDWAGWVLSSGNGLRFTPSRQGIKDLLVQDARAFGGKAFQSCWTMAQRGTVHAGDILQCTIGIEPLSADQIVKPAFAQGLSLLSVSATLTPSAGGDQVVARLEVRNLTALPRRLDVACVLTDEVAAQLGRIGETGMDIAPMGVAVKEASVKATSRGDYRLDVEVADGENRVKEAAQRRVRMDVVTGARNEVSLNGEWDFLPLLEGEPAYPPQGDWRKRTVPSYLDATSIRHNACWYRRSFEVPKCMEGKRIKIRFGAVNFDAKVFVNGKSAGGCLGGYLPFTVDVTDLVRIGGPNELCVAVTCWKALCKEKIEPFEPKPLEHPYRYIPKNSMLGPMGAGFLMTGIWQDVSLIAFPKVYVEDVFVQTSVRKKEIKAEVTVKNEDAVAHTVDLGNVVLDRDGQAMRLKAQGVSVGPGEVKKVAVVEGWAAPKLWSIEQPHLYRLETTLDEGGKRMDEKSTRFGFREVWTEGPKLLLNGMPMTLFATSTWHHARWEEAVATIREAKQANCRAMRLHTQPAEEHNLDAADEMGFLIVDEAAVYCRHDRYATNDERFWQNYAQHVRGLALRDRNHPSLFMYSLENEILLCGAKWEVWEKRLADLSDVVRAVDPTRLITYEADLDPCGKADVIGLHYPCEYWSGYTLYPQKAYWMDEDIKTCGVSWKWKRDKPLYIGEFDGGFFAWYPQYQAFWAGDEVYAEQQIPNKTSPANAKARRETVVQDIAAYRSYGVAGMCAWVFREELQQVGEIVFTPLFLHLRERSRSFYSGDTVHRMLLAHNDLFKSVDLQVKWQVSEGERIIRSGEIEAQVKPTECATAQIEFKAPATERKTALLLSVRLYCEGKEAYKVEQALSVFPPPGPAPSVGPLVLLDKVGRTQSILDRLKVKYRKVEDLSGLSSADCRALVIGYRSLGGETAAQAPKLAEFVADGGIVLCFEQEDLDAKWLPLSVTVDPKHVCTTAFARVPTHPILKDISGEDLRFWQADNIVAEGSFVKPAKGNWRAIVDAGGIKSSVHDMNGLNWSPLMEVPYGKGAYVLCQLGVTTKFGTEPVAEKVILNMIEHAAKAPENTYVRVGVLAEANSAFERMLRSAGLVYDRMLGRLSQSDLSGYGVVIVGASPAIWGEVEQGRGKLRDFAKAGGVVWLHNVKPEQAQAVKDLIEMDFTLTPVGEGPMWKACDDPTTAGLSNHELYWRERPIWDLWTPYRRVADFAFSPAQPNARAKALTEPAALVKVESGKGFFLMDQLLWDVEEKNRTEGFKIISNLLTNLRAGLGSYALRPVNLQDFFQVDLKPYCNLSFRGEVGKGGWMGHGEGAIAEFTPGLKALGRVPFQVIDAAANGGKSCIVLAGKAKPYFPKEVKGIRVGKRAGSLYFLHTCAWGKEGLPAGRYVVHYRDGKAMEIPLRVDMEIRDWYTEPASTGFADLAWAGNYQGVNPDHMPPELLRKRRIGVYSFEWTNPYPEQEIESIDFISAADAPIPVLIGVTGTAVQP